MLIVDDLPWKNLVFACLFLTLLFSQEKKSSIDNSESILENPLQGSQQKIGTFGKGVQWEDWSAETNCKFKVRLCFGALTDTWNQKFGSSHFFLIRERHCSMDCWAIPTKYNPSSCKNHEWRHDSCYGNFHSCGENQTRVFQSHANGFWKFRQSERKAKNSLRCVEGKVKRD